MKVENAEYLLDWTVNTEQRWSWSTKLHIVIHELLKQTLNKHDTSQQGKQIQLQALYTINQIQITVPAAEKYISCDKQFQIQFSNFSVAIFCSALSAWLLLMLLPFAATYSLNFAQSFEPFICFINFIYSFADSFNFLIQLFSC